MNKKPKAYVKQKEKQKTSQKKQKIGYGAAEPTSLVSIEAQLERFADILLDIFLTNHHEAKK